MSPLPPGPLPGAQPPLLATLAPRFAVPDHGMFPPTGPGERACVAAEAMDLGVEYFNLNEMDRAIAWFTTATIWHYPGAESVRDAVTRLRDSLTAAEIDHLIGDDTRHAGQLSDATQAVVDRLVAAAELAAQAIAGTTTRLVGGETAQATRSRLG